MTRDLARDDSLVVRPRDGAVPGDVNCAIGVAGAYPIAQFTSLGRGRYGGTGGMGCGERLELWGDRGACVDGDGAAWLEAAAGCGVDDLGRLAALARCRRERGGAWRWRLGVRHGGKQQLRVRVLAVVVTLDQQQRTADRSG